MKINLLYLIAAILVVLTLIYGPVLYMFVLDKMYLLPTYSLPSSIEGIMPMIIDYANVVSTFILVLTVPVLLIYAFIGKHSRIPVFLVSFPTFYIAIMTIVLSVISYIKPVAGCSINPIYILLLISFMLTSTSDIYDAALVLPSGQRAGLLDYLRLSKKAGKPKGKVEGEKTVEEEAEEQKTKEGEESEKKEVEKTQEAEEKEEKEEKSEEESDVLSEIAKEILRG